MIINAFVQGLLDLFAPGVIAWIFIGSVIAIIVGILPGISGLTACALLLPFTFGMKPEQGLPFLLAMGSVAFTGAALTSILVNIPGDGGPSAATLMDGFPMTQKGEARRAIGASVTASTSGGIASVFISLLTMPILIPFVLLFRSPEMFFTIVVGLVFLAGIVSGSVIKGLIAGGLGIMVSFVGFQAISSVTRFTFGSTYLNYGVPLIPIALGIFAIPEFTEMAAQEVTISAGGQLAPGGIRQTLQGAKDVYVHKWLWLRSVVIGYIIGVVPGIGGSVPPFIAYGQAKMTSKHPELFGTGIVEGVIAPESANNACKPGDLLTTLVFGIPGSAVMAILIGAFWMMGLTPGPRMITDHLPLCFTMQLSLVMANAIAGSICFFGGVYLARITTVHPYYLFCSILPLIFAGAFATIESMLSVVVLLVSGAVGFFMKRFGYSRPAFLLGFVLGDLFEYYFFHSLYAFGNLFFLSPICLFLIATGFVGLTYNQLGPLVRRWLRGGVRRTS